jgi:hypothetical protein
MRTTVLFIAIFLFGNAQALAQAPTQVRGRITDRAGAPLPGANVTVKGSYDGGSANAQGEFKFTTTEAGRVVLVASFVGYQSAEQPAELKGQPLEVSFKLNEAASELNTVTISAGAFEASDAKKMVMLRPLDIATTAGANADIFAAIQTLPGAQAQADQEGLFVRGGAASETRTIIDGTIVQNPFGSNTPDVPARGRFSPFLFKGTSFSTGGYSAQYGQALSSVLVLNTNDLPDSTQSAASLSAVGVGGSHTQRWANTSLSAEVDYTNLAPLFAVVPQNVDWSRPPSSLGGATNFRHRPSDRSIVKLFGSYRDGQIGLRIPNFDDPTAQSEFRNQNRNLYVNTSYQLFFGKGQRWSFNGGASYSHDRDQIKWDANGLGRHEERWQARGVVSRQLGENSSLLAGAELHRYRFGSSFNEFAYDQQDVFAAAFIEGEIYLTRKLAARVGVRGEHTQLLGRANVAPRLSLAYKTGPYSQLGFAFGHFYQSPENRYLFTNQQLDFEKAAHYIANFQLIKNRRTFRIEAYYKDYQQLVYERNQLPHIPNRFRQPTGNTDNGGYGYAQGLDIFWRDQKSIRGFDYWVSYSLVDTRRLFQNFLAEAVPTFVAKHTLNVVARKYVSSLSTSFNASYAVASGRPYYNPNNPEFHGDRTAPFSNLSLAANYLTRIAGNFAVVVLSVNNVLGTQNVFGYRYSADGTHRVAVGQAAPRFFFLGVFMTLK